MLITMAIALAAAAEPASKASGDECERSISRLLGSAGPDTRVVITFTGSQKALLPLDERATASMESTLFPVGIDRFVLSLQLRPSQPNQSMAAAFAKQVCSIGLSGGGRFNGVMSFKRQTATVDGQSVTRENMTDAIMAEPEGR